MRMPVDAKKFTPTRFGSIHHCSDCDLGFIHPRPTAEETAEFYDLDAYYTQGRSHYVQARESFLDKLRVHLAWRMDYGAAIADVIAGTVSQGGAILDVGCGGGELINALSDRGYNCVGVERDAKAISVRAGSVLAGSAEHLPPQLPPSSFDAIVYSHVVEHLVDPVTSLRDAAKLLNPGGAMIIEVPNNACFIAEQMGLAWENLDPPRHLSFFTERSLHELLRRAGFEVQSTYYTGFCRHFTATYIATEQRIYDQLAFSPPALRNSRLRSWMLLLRTELASKQRKYDAVGIITRAQKSRH
jgi:2-polyprenyl-3-methyl-5-hydroxy-6-metoxy-1,4-benzoquinol methylase